MADNASASEHIDDDEDAAHRTSIHAPPSSGQYALRSSEHIIATA